MKNTKRNKSMPIDYKDLPSVVTPPGIAIWPKLTEPDHRFKKEDGEYTCKLRIEGEDAETLISTIKAFHAEAYAVECEDKKKKKLKLADFPFAPAVDDDDEEIPGVFIFNTKRRASGELKKGPRAGQRWHAHLTIVDSQNNPLPKGIDPWGGTKLRANVRMKPWYTPSLGFGIKLELQGVRIIDLVEGGKRAPSDLFPDEEEESGYVATSSTDGDGEEYGDDDVDTESTEASEGEDF
jgi:hypothetical protein